jgi:hypothetical protein
VVSLPPPVPRVAIAEANCAVLWGDLVASYRVLTGIDYPPGRRAEAGDVVDDIPGKSIKWLVECGAIEKAEDKPSKKSKQAPEKPVEEEIVIVEAAAGSDDDEEDSVWPMAISEDDTGEDA